VGGNSLSFADQQSTTTEVTITTTITDPVEILFQIGLDEVRRGQYASAIKIFKSLAAKKASPRIQLELARALFLDHRYQESEKVFNQVLRLPNLPWTVQENIRAYLDAIDAALGYFKLSLSLVSDSNPRNFTDSQQIRVFGQTLRIIPPEDNKEIWGARYNVNAAKDFSGKGSVTGYLNASYSDFEDSQFDRWGADAGLFFRSRSLPKLKLRVGLEESYYGGDHLYEFPYVGLIYNPEPVYQFKTSNEIKVGWLRVPHAEYLDATNLSLTSRAVRHFTENVYSSWEIYLEQAFADEKSYSYYGGSLGMDLSFAVLQNWDVRPYASIGQRNYESADIFFGKTRRDTKKTLGIGIANQGLRVFNFVPEMELRYQKNSSEISYYSFDKFLFLLTWSK
jgi:tetratricopeptide (TPR) repeat protein